MSGGRHLRLLPAPEDRDTETSVKQEARSAERSTTERATEMSVRVLAPGAPSSPGTMPLELARELRVGEAVIWWNQKDTIHWRLVGWVFAAGLLILAIGTLFAPELWLQPLDELWKTVVPALLPAPLLAAREWYSQRAIIVTDNSVIGFDHRGRVDRIGFRNVRTIKRDLLTGGVLLEGTAHRVRIPPSLADDARQAIASQLRNTVRATDELHDALGWFPR